jgi:hypothetical protein
MRIGFVESRLYDMQGNPALFPGCPRGKAPERPRHHNGFDAPQQTMYNPLFPESLAVSLRRLEGNIS